MKIEVSKIKIYGMLMLSVAFILTLTIVISSDSPPNPFFLTGNVVVDCETAPQNTIIDFYIDNAKIKSTNVDSNGKYNVIIQDRPLDYGKTIIIKINNHEAKETVIYNPLQNIYLDLSFLINRQECTPYYLFVTNSQYDGNLEGIAGADIICNNEFRNPGEDLHYKAFISTNGNYPSATSLGMDTSLIIYSADTGLKIADNYADLTDGTPLDNVVFEDSTCYDKNGMVWTGRDNWDCTDWQQNISFSLGSAAFGCSTNFWSQGQTYCSDKLRLYCLGPFAGAPDYCGDGTCKGAETAFNCVADCAPLLQKDRYFMFVTNSSYDGDLGGIEGANEKCNSDANKPTGKFWAFISSNTSYPIIEGLNQALPIYSADTLKRIANNYYDLTDGIIENPIYPKSMWTRVWTKAFSGINACNNWTSNSSEEVAYYGYPYYPFLPVLESLWWSNGFYGCNNQGNHLYCIGQYNGEDTCGDGIITPALNEICDDGGNNGLYGYCKSDCSGLGSHCGDGINNTGFETCDDGANNGNYNYCNSTCGGYVTIGCGDTICNNNETCSSCPGDCGACVVTLSGGGSSGGGGGGTTGGGGSSGGGAVITPRTTTPMTSTANEYTATNQETTNGYTQELNMNDKINFEIKSETKTEQHSLIIDNIGSDFVEITIQSEPIKVKLIVGEEKKLNLTSSGYYDLYVKLESIENSKAKITIKTINEQIIIKQTGITGAAIGFAKTGAGILIIVIIIIVFGTIIITLISNKIKKRKIKKIEEKENNFDKKKEKGKLKNSHSI